LVEKRGSGAVGTKVRVASPLPLLIQSAASMNGESTV
jgi:hypothetical protein